MNLLSKRVAKRMDELASELSASSEHTIKSNEQRDGQKSATGKAVPPVAGPISVVAVRAKVGAMEAVRIPERAEDKTEYQRDCREDKYCWDDDESEHCVFSIQITVYSCPAHRPDSLGEPVKD